MSTIILNVVIILGIIIAGGFLIFFVGDLLLSIIDPKSDERKIKAKRKKDVAKFNEKLEKLDPEDAKEIKEDARVAEILALVDEDEKQEAQEKVVDEQSGAIVENYTLEEEQPNKVESSVESKKLKKIKLKMKNLNKKKDLQRLEPL